MEQKEFAVSINKDKTIIQDNYSFIVFDDIVSKKLDEVYEKFPQIIVKGDSYEETFENATGNGLSIYLYGVSVLDLWTWRDPRGGSGEPGRNRDFIWNWSDHEPLRDHYGLCISDSGNQGKTGWKRNGYPYHGDQACADPGICHSLYYRNDRIGNEHMGNRISSLGNTH